MCEELHGHPLCIWMQLTTACNGTPSNARRKLSGVVAAVLEQRWKATSGHIVSGTQGPVS